MGILRDICGRNSQTQPTVIKISFTKSRLYAPLHCSRPNKPPCVNKFQINVKNGVIFFGFLPFYFVTASLSSRYLFKTMMLRGASENRKKHICMRRAMQMSF